MTEKMAKKGHVWKETGVITQGRREVEVGTVLLDNDKNNVNADKNFCFLFLVNNNVFFDTKMQIY